MKSSHVIYQLSQHQRWRVGVKAVRSLGKLIILLISITTFMFFALRMAGDPIIVLAGENASVELIEEIKKQYGFDRPLIVQYILYISNIFRLDFGESLSTGQPALSYVLSQLPATLLLAALGMAVTLAISIPAGAWLGMKPDAWGRRVMAGAVFFMQGLPGFVTALLLIQVFVVQLMWFPSLGYSQVKAWILPSISLASFLAPKLIRMISANVSEAMREEYIRTARSVGAPGWSLLWREAVPNAILGAVALIGTQFAFLFAGAVIIEVLFLWPGIGLLLFRSAQVLDFPVLQATAFIIAILVFSVNAMTNMAFEFLDPRMRRAAP